MATIFTIFTPRRTGLLAAAAAALLAGTAHGQVIRLERQARVEPRQDVRLGDIATVTGVDRQTAEALSNTVILSAVETSRTVKAEAVLLALMSQRGPAAVGSGLQMSGSAACSVTVEPAPTAPKVAAREDAVSPAPAAPQPAAAAAAPTTAPAAEVPASLAVAIRQRVHQELALPTDEVRVKFETINPLLDAPVPANRKWLCRPLTRTLLGTVQFEAQLVERTRVVEKLTVQTKVERRQTVVVSLTKLGRGDVVPAGGVRVEETWVDRHLPTLFKADADVVGLEAQRAIDLGATLDQRDFKPPLLAAKGDAVKVVYLAGSLQVEMLGRALEGGKMHDLVAVRNEVTGDRYQAVLIGKRLAVVGGTLDPTLEQKLREAH
jgi:flagella basal body P-ring formation protein FlgA